MIGWKRTRCDMIGAREVVDQSGDVINNFGRN